MKKLNLIIRMDDACPEMDKAKWGQMEALLDRYGIKPVVAVVPDCQDPHLKKENPDKDFWKNVQEWQRKNWTIALHGYDHVYIGKKAGLVPLNKQTEFAGIAEDLQRERIKKGYAILKEKGLDPQVWIAPSHTFDKTTLKCLKEETPIRIISDGLAKTPFRRFNFVWIPQQLWGPRRKLPKGTWTLCYHPNEMEPKDFIRLEAFLEERKDNFISFDLAARNVNRSWGIWDKGFEVSFFIVRPVKNFIARGLKRIGLKK